MAWAIRYLAILKAKIKGNVQKMGELTAEEESEAEKHLCRCVQSSVYSAEVNSLRQGQRISKDSTLLSLNPILSPEGLMRVNGRINGAMCLPIEARQPIILPPNHPMSILLVDHYHKKFLHQNTATVISEIRHRFWIPSLRRVLNTVKSKCCFCKLKKTIPRQPQMGILQSDRGTPFVRPFSYTGLDYFGPIIITNRRGKEKRWVALFTCLTIRAIHLEVATDLSSDACILCIRNFINRRGVPVLIRSDNGTNFVGLPKELKGCKDFIDHNQMTASLAPLGIKWKFNTPSDPSAGGAWERLVQSVKKSLYFALKEIAPRAETFYSLLVEIENIVNSRPLTHLPVTPEEEEPLTPNHFLLGCASSTQTPAPPMPHFNFLRKQWRILQNLKNRAWRRWIQEYLPELTRRSKWCLPSQSLSEGCLVLIVDGSLPRSQWRRGRILKLNTGLDGVARSAEVVTSSGVLRRPISKLAILDVVCPS